LRRTPVDKQLLEVFDSSLARCNATNGFLSRFYDKFLASSPKVREKFAHTDFTRQKKALRESFQVMRLAAAEQDPERHLKHLAESHSSRQLNIGSELYDLWLDSLLATVKETDVKYNATVEAAWERVMMVGIDYLMDRY